MPVRSQSLIPLNSGAYSARSKLANFQVCENLFPELNPEDADPDVAVTHYPRGGLRPLSSPPALGLGRGVFTLSNGALYSVVGTNVYYVDQNWVHHLIGTIGFFRTPVSISDNGTTAVLVDGSPNGYTITLNNNALSVLVDPTGLFVGSNRVDYADTFLAFAAPGTNEWYVSLSNQVAFNIFAQATKDSTPDIIQTIAFNIRQMWLLGTQNSEVWYLAGSTPFPYQEWPNVFIQYGCAAIYSVTKADINLFWVSENDQGQAIIVQTNGYGVTAISTRAIEYELSLYPTIADAIGSTYQQGGHTFVEWSFPTANVTWVYDLATKQWHQNVFTDANGVRNRSRTCFYAPVSNYGGYTSTIVGQDWQTGQLYAVDQKFYLDGTSPIILKRTFPHVMQDMKFITHVSFVADFETGGIVSTGEDATSTGQPPTLNMRYSNDGGGSFGNYRQKTLASSGHYRSMMRYRGLGMARDRVYELMWSYPGPSTLQGAYIEPIGHGA